MTRQTCRSSMAATLGWRTDPIRLVWFSFIVGGAVIWFGAGLSATRVFGQSESPTYAMQVAEGARLAERLCASCHATGARSDAVVPAGVPSMRGIANQPGQTAERLKHFMMNPHPPMPDTRLSFTEVDRLITYMDSLRAEGSGAPLVPRPKDKPKPIDPS